MSRAQALQNNDKIMNCDKVNVMLILVIFVLTIVVVLVVF